MKVAIIVCREVTKICTSIGCMRAFNERTGSFTQYGEAPLTLCAFATCIGCDDAENGSPEFAKRIEDLKKNAVEKIHLGICTSGKYCKYTDELINVIKSYGFEVEMGTHK